MTVRTVFVLVGIISAAIGCVAEVSALASADNTAPPVIVVATIPPAPTPLPPLVLPREEFAEQAAITSDSSQGSTPGSPQAAQLALASYGVVTVSYDEQHPENSVALIATPHGVVMAHVGQVIDGYRLVNITESGVVFQGGAVIPVGYSQQGSNPTVPPVGTTFPAQSVRVNVIASPSPVGSPPSQSTEVAPPRPLVTPPPVRRNDGARQPVILDNQTALPTPQPVTVIGEPTAVPSP